MREFGRVAPPAGQPGAPPCEPGPSIELLECRVSAAESVAQASAEARQEPIDAVS
jgi:hypothetical protein